MYRRTGIAALAALALLAVWWWSGENGGQPNGTAIVAVAVPDLSENAAIGKAIFDVNCRACHGENASGLDGFGPPLVHKIYEPGHHSDAAFELAVKNGVRAHHWTYGNMPPVDNVSAEQTAQIVVYVRELQRSNGIE
ncbi:MAG: cytochrome c [Hyphomicrobiales bacterium]|nr:cytochrome c [Hyphomicrobiales bacterium]MCP5000628.1 cytochrome c [Hyphomicrobiales bacterium]